MRAMVERAESELDRDLRITQRSRKLALVSHYLAVLLASGVPLVQSLEAIQAQTEDPLLAHALECICRRVQNGHPLSHALRYFSGIFPPVFSGLVAVGENTGALVEAVRHLAAVLEKEDKLDQKVRGALAYPAFILALTGSLTLVMFRFVLPTFVELFSGVGGTLPLPTRCVLALTRWVGTVWFWIGSVGLIYGMMRLFRELWAQPERQLVMYRMLLTIPLLGDVIKYATLARFCWVMQLTLRTGLDLMRCLQLSVGASNSPLLQHDLAAAQASIRAGETLSDHLSLHPEVYPKLLRQFVKLGEEATEFSSAFGHAAGWFEEEVEVRIELFKAALEPLLMVTVALIVGGIVLSIFLPLYGLLDKLA